MTTVLTALKEFVKLLQQWNVLTAAVVFGAIAVIIAMIGRIRWIKDGSAVTVIDLSFPSRIVLAVFGVFLAGVPLGGYMNTFQTQCLNSPGQNNATIATPTLVISELPGLPPPTAPKAVSCVINGRAPLPDRISCSSGALAVSTRIVGSTHSPDWGRKFSGLTSQIDLAEGVAARVRIEQWGPINVYDTLEHAGWLSLERSTSMTKEFGMVDEVTNSEITIKPDNMAQELQASFAFHSMNTFVARICEDENPCRGQIAEFAFVP